MAGRGGEWFEKVALGRLPERAAARWGSREALVFEERRWSFRELAEDVDRAARGLLALGVEPGEKVSLWFPDRPTWLHAFYGALKIGATLLPLNTRLRSHDIAYAIEASDTRTLIVADRAGPVDFLEMLLEIAPELAEAEPAGWRADGLPQLSRVLLQGKRTVRGALDWDGVLRRADEVSHAELEARAARVDPDDPALICFTSGSTGRPKGVVLTHSLVRNAVDQANRLAITPRDTILMYLPLFHAFGLYEGVLMLPISGARMVLQEHFDASAALELIERERCTLTHGFDTHFADLLQSPELSRRDTGSLRLGILAAGMASSEKTARAVQRHLCPTVSAWGMTEVGACAMLGFPDDSEEHRCLRSGHPLPGYDIRVVEPATGDALPLGEPGELQVRSYMTMREYYKAPEATAASFTEDGWFRTGDQVVPFEDGSIRFLGRYREMLKVGGENVDPFEVEAFLQQHPSVARVQVVGVPDRRLSEVPVACVVPSGDGAPDPTGLLELCRGQLASFKIPRRVFFVKEFPMTSSGKVQRFRLRAQVRDWVGEEEG